MNIGDIAAREKLTGRLYFQRAGQPFVDLGNVLLVKLEPKIDQAQQLTAKKGRMQITHEAPSKIDPRWSLKLDERTGPALQLLSLAKAKTTIHNNALGTTVDITPQRLVTAAEAVANPTLLTGWRVFWPGTAVDLGQLNVVNVVITSTFGGVPTVVPASVYKVAGGVITFTALCAWDAATTVSCQFEYDDTPTTQTSYTLFAESFVAGQVKLVMEDQISTPAKSVATFPAELRASDWGDDDGQKTNEFSFELLATGAITLLSRD